MTKEELKKELQKLKDKLIENFAIYHERVTLLIQLTLFEIEDTRVNFSAKIIKPLDKKDAEKNKLYQNIIAKNEISFSASYLFGANENSSLLEKNKLARPYCPFTLWLDPELAKFVIDNEDEITKQLPRYILWSEDWKKINTKNYNQNK